MSACALLGSARLARLSTRPLGAARELQAARGEVKSPLSMASTGSCRAGQGDMRCHRRLQRELGTVGLAPRDGEVFWKPT